ncbi:MAG: SpoIIIAH-like family protein [Lachnospiraceae bacterium]
MSMKIFKHRKSLKDVNMKKLFRRNQIIITTLAVMIAAAGYLNYAGKKEMEASGDDVIFEAGLLEISDEDLLNENRAANYDLQPEADLVEAEQLAEIDSWDYEGEEAGLGNPGEAVLTSGMSVSDYIAGVQLNREQIRAKNKETLSNIINNTNIDEAAKQEAIQSMIEMTAISEKENAAETLLQAKGFADPVVSLSDGKVDVVINAATITDPQRAQIEDIVKRKVGVAAEDIIISLLNLNE